MWLGGPTILSESSNFILQNVSGRSRAVPLAVFGDHNLQNLNAARLVCEELSVSEHMFLEAIQSFTGASKRLELVKKSENTAVYKDFAHSPSKLKATSAAMKKQFPKISCLRNPKSKKCESSILAT